MHEGPDQDHLCDHSAAAGGVFGGGDHGALLAEHPADDSWVHPGDRARGVGDCEEVSGGREIRPEVRAMARLLDARFGVPGTSVRFGLDTVLGLLPVAGDTVTLAMGAVVVMEGVRLGVRKRVLARMVGNLALDWVVGLVPVADVVFDTVYKANMKNLALLEREVGGGAGLSNRREVGGD